MRPRSRQSCPLQLGAVSRLQLLHCLFWEPQSAAHFGSSPISTLRNARHAPCASVPWTLGVSRPLERWRAGLGGLGFWHPLELITFG